MSKGDMNMFLEKETWENSLPEELCSKQNKTKQNARSRSSRHKDYKARSKLKSAQRNEECRNW